MVDLNCFAYGLSNHNKNFNMKNKIMKEIYCKTLFASFTHSSLYRKLKIEFERIYEI